jgi:ADP-heptose:LPS heptosyltransferase
MSRFSADGISSPVGLPVSVSLLQRADLFVFAPLCFILTILRRLLPKPDSLEGQKPRALLFVKLAEQGSTVLATRAIQRAIDWVGKENVYFLVFEENRFVLDVMDVVPRGNVLTVATTSLYAMVTGTLGALRRVRSLQIDAAIDLEFFARFSAALTWLSGARWRAGMHAFFGEGPYRGDLFTHRVLYNAHIHTSAMFLTVVEALARPAGQLPTLDFAIAPAGESAPLFHAFPDEIDRVRTVLREKLRGPTETRLILLNPNASDLIPLRRWPVDRYSALAREIIRQLPEVHVIFTGLKSEAEAIESLVGAVGSPRCFSLAGMTTLRELLVLYGLSEVLVTNDSGPAHFAALTPIDVITLFGPETPSLFAASGPRNTVVFQGLACSPCVNALNNRQSVCRDNQCMKQISVERVLDATLVTYRGRVLLAKVSPFSG